MTALGCAAIAAAATARFPLVQARRSDNGRPFLAAPREQALALLQFLRTEPTLAFDALMDLTAYDLLKYPAAPPSSAIAVVYLLFSHRHHHETTVKVFAEREDCRVDSVGAEWPAALYFEREVWDLFGVHFTGHPKLDRILCPDDWHGHALRKDYVYPADYRGVAHLRDGQHFEGSPPRSDHGGTR